MGKDKDKDEKKEIEGITITGSLRPDGTSYDLSIPREVYEKLGLRGGESFEIKAKPEKRKISLKLVSED